MVVIVCPECGRKWYARGKYYSKCKNCGQIVRIVNGKQFDVFQKTKVYVGKKPKPVRIGRARFSKEELLGGVVVPEGKKKVELEWYKCPSCDFKANKPFSVCPNCNEEIEWD